MACPPARQRVSHAGAGVHSGHELERNLLRTELRQRLEPVIVIDLEVACRQIGDEAAVPVGDHGGDLQHVDIDGFRDVERLRPRVRDDLLSVLEHRDRANDVFLHQLTRVPLAGEGGTLHGADLAGVGEPPDQSDVGHEAHGFEGDREPDGAGHERAVRRGDDARGPALGAGAGPERDEDRGDRQGDASHWIAGVPGSGMSGPPAVSAEM